MGKKKPKHKPFAFALLLSWWKALSETHIIQAICSTKPQSYLTANILQFHPNLLLRYCLFGAWPIKLDVKHSIIFSHQKVLPRTDWILLEWIFAEILQALLWGSAGCTALTLLRALLSAVRRVVKQVILQMCDLTKRRSSIKSNLSYFILMFPGSFQTSLIRSCLTI